MNNNPCTIPIVVNDQINPMFVRANSFILSQNVDSFVSNNNEYNERKIEELWQTVFNAQLIKTHLNVWTNIVFDSDSDKTMFLLKYST